MVLGKHLVLSTWTLMEEGACLDEAHYSYFMHLPLRGPSDRTPPSDEPSDRTPPSESPTEGMLKAL